MNNLNLNDELDSLNLDSFEDGCFASLKLIESFQNRKIEVEKLLLDPSLSKFARKELKLELQMIEDTIKEYKKI